MAPQESLLKVYGDRSYRHVTMARHQGTTIAFAMDSARRIVYSVLDLAGQQSKGDADAAYWSDNPAELVLPRELAEVGFAVAGATAMPTVKRGGAEAAVDERPLDSEIDPYLSTTARLTADAPFHVVSDGTYVVVLRQSIGETHPDAVYKLTDGGCSANASRTDYVLSGTKKVPLVRDTLLCDRFLLVDGKLKPVLEVRYKRSRHATRPASAKDTLGTEDMEGRPFYEPTQELSFIRNLTRGRFAAVLVPTAVSSARRWQLFAHNDATGRIDSFSVEQGVQGLFNTQGTRFYTSPDPVYRDAVFERSPGTCPFTNQDLVPVTSTEGHAETALGLTGANDAHVDLGDPAALRFGGKAYSIEAWVKPTAYDRPVISRGGEYRFGLDAGGSLRLAHEGAATAVVSVDTVPKDVYTHVAATFDGTTAKLYVNGKLSGSGAMPFTPATGVNTLLGKQVSGATVDLFEGDVDEVRVWDRVRSATELADDLNHRLVGNEAGLVAYYRFDEGSGAVAYDQSDRALHGTLKGGAKWTGSDAPVGDHPGVRRDSFVLKGRTVESGMSAVIYHQQENVSAGYRPDPKPAKRQARVMLAFAAKYGQEPALVSLDFAVGRDGRLAQVPDVLDPAVLRRPGKGQDSEQVSALQQLIRQLEPEVAALPAEITRLAATAGQVAYWQGEHDRLLPGFERLERQYLAEKDVPTAWNYALEVKTPRQVDGQSLRYFHAPIHTSVIVSLSPSRSTWRLEATGESQNGKPFYWLVGNNVNNLDLHIYKNSSAQNAVLDTVVREPGNGFTQFQLTAEGEYTRIVNRGSKLALGMSSSFPAPVPVQASECATGDSGLIKMVPVSLRSGVDTAYLQAKNEMNTVRERLQEAKTAAQRVNELQLVLTGKQTQLKDAQEKLARLSTALQGDDDLTVAMPLISVDTTGLSLSGGLLEFARGTDRPALLDSGTGTIVLYFRGANEQFFAVYYDTAVTRGTQRLTGNGGTLGFLARDPGVLLDSCTIKVTDGDAPSRCDLTVTVGGDTETWRSLPRKAEQMAAALAGQSGQAVTVGTVAQVTGTTVEFTAAITTAVTAKAHLQIGVNGYAASAEAPVGSKTLTLTGSGTAIKPGDTVTVVGYDWARAESTRVGVLLSAGSRLITLNTGGATSVPNGTAVPVTGGRGCRWRAEMPGRAFLFDGKDQYLTLSATQQKNAAPAGDLTLEAWVNPEAGQGRVIHGRTDGSGYSLALAAVDLPARQFTGTTKVELTNALDLAGRDFTVELWAKRNQARGRREPLLTHGVPTGAKDQTLHLHFEPNDTFTFALFGDDLTTPQSYPDLGWHHWAAVYKHATREQILYRDGTEVHRRTATGAYTGNGPLILGHQPFTGDHLDGQIDEVRVFGRARTAQEISAERNQRLSGREPGLLGHWTFNEPNSPASPIKGYQVVARVGDRVLRSADRFPCNEWAHLAATFTQAWALRLDGGEGLSVASQDSLNVLEDLTIEAFVQVDKVGAPMALVTKGTAVNGGREGVPYQLGILADGRVEFAFAEADGNPVRYVSDRAVKPGAFQRISVVRQRRKAEVSAATGTQAAAAGQPEQDIRFYLDGALAGTYVYGGPGAQSNTSALEIGRGLNGVLCEVRLWSSARTFNHLGRPVAVREKGLLARWAFEENAGNTTLDASGSFPAKLRGARWTRDVDPAASPLRLYRNGEPLLATTAPLPADLLPYGDPQLTLGARLEGGKPTELLTGTLEEVRIWRTVRTREQILDNLFTRLRGDKQDLLGYWTFDRDSTAATTTSVRDEGLRGNNLAFSTKRPRILLSTAPVSTDTAQVRSALADVRTPFHDTVSGAPAASEYADLQFDAKGETLGVLKRCYGFVRDGRWHLVTGYKVGDLTTEWVGQAQFDPQLMGYIEGAPPVPSENLTDKPDGFPGASSVEFTEADQVVHSLSASKTRSTNTAFNVSFGLETVADVMTVAAPLGFGTASPLAEGQLKMAATAGLEFSNTWSEDTSVSQGKNTARKTKLELTGYTEDPANVLNSDLGPRYVPANTGMALVQSQTADVFALRLAHTGALVAYRMLPNPDIPLDWNIVHFPINPRYTKQGTLDGAVGFDAFGKVTDPDYPTATAYGEYSYFKPRDAYALKRRITRDQQRLQAFYQSISTDVGHNSGTEPAETQAKAVLRSMGMSAEQQDSTRSTTGSAAAAGFSHRDLVNTYVWTAQGGFFAETTEATDAVSETTSGSYEFTYSYGGNFDLSFGALGLGWAFHLDASRGGGFSTTRAKSKEASRSFGLDVQCAPSNDLQRRDSNGKPKYDAAGKPVLVPGKVDAYRFLTFYLGESSANFDDFYHKVVDPTWLQGSNAPDAAALRQTRQSSAKPPCWRVLHRVTYISRVLAPVPPPGAPPLERAMRTENIASNYELIKRLEPYVRPAATSSANLAAATRDALTAHLPELLPHAAEITEYLGHYFGMEN